MKTFLLVASVLALAAVLLASPASGGRGKPQGTASKRTSVSVKDDFFSPKTKRVSSGTTVTWRWRGSDPHNVRFRKVPSGASKRGSHTQESGRFSRTFSTRGRYRYVCTIHEDVGMTGTVRVE
jgi:plastocyanin